MYSPLFLQVQQRPYKVAMSFVVTIISRPIYLPVKHNSYLSTQTFKWLYMAVPALAIFIVPANQQLVALPS